MNITKDLQIHDLFLYSKQHNALIFSDVHIGFEESLNKQGILIPRFQFKEIMQRLESTFKELTTKHKLKSFKSIIINGDLKHEFGRISEQEWRHTIKLLDFLAKHTDNIVLVRGNHDTILGPIAKKRNVQPVDNHILGNILLTHGDNIPHEELLKDIKTIIIGHEHPAISLQESSRVETFKCFLKGTYKKKTLIVLPSCNIVTEGSNLLQHARLSPLMPKNIDNFEAYIIADRIYKPIKIKQLL
ncbi:MAG: metallophosphoesterase [Nanoarchaeota archaeon]|nr:metallophosphoesterase [Nanoarchaeota archaeon]